MSSDDESGNPPRGAGDRKRAAGPSRQYFVPVPGSEGPSSARPPKKAVAAPPPPAAPRRVAVPPAQRTAPAAPPRGPGSPGGPARPAATPKRRRGRKRWLLLVPLVLLVALLAGVFWARGVYGKIERVDLTGVLDPIAGDSTNYLLVGSDSRSEFDPEGDSGVTGRRSDTIILLRTTPDGASMMSIPRDLWVTVASTGQKGRINGAYNDGPANLVQTVKDNLQVPVNHYMEVGFASFAGLVDAIGGVTINFEHPAYDDQSGLLVEQAGEVVLDGQQALAYARSRHYTEVIDGQESTDPTADIGRQMRQQQFLRTALSEVGATRNPITLVRVADSMSSELIIDSGLGMGEAFSLVRKLGSTDPETVILPVIGVRKGNAAVLELDEPGAQVALGQFR